MNSHSNTYTMHIEGLNSSVEDGTIYLELLTHSVKKCFMLGAKLVVPSLFGHSMMLSISVALLLFLSFSSCLGECQEVVIWQWRNYQWHVQVIFGNFLSNLVTPVTSIHPTSTYYYVYNICYAQTSNYCPYVMYVLYTVHMYALCASLVPRPFALIAAWGRG